MITNRTLLSGTSVFGCAGSSEQAVKSTDLFRVTITFTVNHTFLIKPKEASP